jgi:hypothetical protein
MADVKDGVAAAIPGCHATFYPDEGHLSSFANNEEEGLSVLTE